MLVLSKRVDVVKAILEHSFANDVVNCCGEGFLSLGELGPLEEDEAETTLEIAVITALYKLRNCIGQFRIELSCFINVFIYVMTCFRGEDLLLPAIEVIHAFMIVTVLNTLHSIFLYFFLFAPRSPLLESGLDRVKFVVLPMVDLPFHDFFKVFLSPYNCCPLIETIT